VKKNPKSFGSRLFRSQNGVLEEAKLREKTTQNLFRDSIENLGFSALSMGMEGRARPFRETQ